MIFTNQTSKLTHRYTLWNLESGRERTFHYFDLFFLPTISIELLVNNVTSLSLKNTNNISI